MMGRLLAVFTRQNPPAFNDAPITWRLGVVGWLIIVCSAAFAQSVPSPKFEVVSIRKIDLQEPPAICFDGHGLIRPSAASPGRLISCIRLLGLLREAYVTYADRVNAPTPFPIPIEKGPDWVYDDYYLINAKAEDAAPIAVMRGPMQRAMLEDRFKLKLHRETRQVPVYELVVGKNEEKLRQHQTANCTPATTRAAAPPVPALGPSDKPTCRVASRRSTPGTLRLNEGYSSIDGLALALYNPNGGNGFSDRPVVNKTGLKEVFDINLEVNDPTFLGPRDEPLAPSIFTAIEELGFKLVPGKGEQDFLIIDHIERPSEN